VGFYLGKDVAGAGNQITLEDVYVSSYETDIYNVYTSPLNLNHTIIGTSVTALRLATGVTHAEDVYFDSNNDIAINKEAGAYLSWNGVLSSSGSQTITYADHRGYRNGTPIRVMAYRSAALSINGGPTQIVFDAEIEDPESAFNTTTGVFTAPHDGYYYISTSVDFTATATDQTLTVGIYHNAALATGGEGSAHSSSANHFGRTVSLLMWLAATDTIDVRVTTSANMAARQAALNVFNLGW
jgi:hypothetical protein